MVVRLDLLSFLFFGTLSFGSFSLLVYGLKSFILSTTFLDSKCVEETTTTTATTTYYKMW